MTMMWAEAARLRQGLYRFAGGALLPPAADTIPTLRDAAAMLSTMGTGNYAFHGAWLDVVTALERAGADELSVDFIRLFASGTDFSLCPPVESYYRGDAKGGLAGEIGALVSRRAKGLGISLTSPSIPPDHIAAELELMSALCAREATTWERHAGAAVNVLTAEAAFLDAHPAQWVTPFRNRARTVGADGFYRSIIDFVHAYVLHDVAYVRAALRAFKDVA